MAWLEALQQRSQSVYSVQRWFHPQGSRSLQHPPIETGQPVAAAVQRHRQMQRITGTEAEGWILKQIGRLTKTTSIERAQFHSALQQALELLPRGLASVGADAVMALLDAQSAVSLGDQPVAAD
jgi:hypothetical protein